MISEKIKETAFSENKLMNVLERALPFFLFVLCFGVSCLIKYSDGDDAFFLEKVSERPEFLDFTVFLTKTMNGRVAATATLWLVFSNSIWVWRVLNGFMMTAYVLMVSATARLVGKDISSLNSKLIAASSYAIMSVGILGYSCMWITGSVNYLWPTTMGLITFYPFLKSLFRENEYTVKDMIPAFVTGVYTCLAQEQIGATVVAGTAIITAYRIFERRKIDVAQLVAVVLYIAAFAALFLSPANRNRVDLGIKLCLPEYEFFTFGDKLYAMLQWLANALANSLAYLHLLVWGSFTYGFLRKKKTVLFALSLVFTVIVFARCAGVDLLGDLGLNHLDITKIITKAPRFEDLSVVQIIVIAFWLCLGGATPVFAFFYFGERKRRYTAVIMILAALACMAIMMFSSTIYASGERTIFVSAMLLTVVASLMLGRKTDFKGTVILVAILGSAAVLQLLQNKDYLLSMI